MKICGYSNLRNAFVHGSYVCGRRINKLPPHDMSFETCPEWDEQHGVCEFINV